MWVTAMARFIVAIVIAGHHRGAGLRPEEARADKPACRSRSRQKKKDAEAVDKQYKSMMKNTDQAAAPVRVDPWQNMRGADDSKAKR